MKKNFSIEIKELRQRLKEAEEILEAIHYDKIDGVVVLGPEGHKVHLLKRNVRSYRILVETICEGTVVMTDDYSIFYCNSRFAEMVGNAVESVICSSMLNYVPEEEQGEFNSLLGRARNVSCWGRINLKVEDGTLLPVNLSVNSLQMESTSGFCLVITDLSEQQKNEEIIAARTRELEEVNAALNILLKKREEDRSKFEESILANVKYRITPYLENLKQTSSSDKRMAHIEALETRINEIVSPFVRKLSRNYMGLTGMEIQVADLIREGKSSKEIADLLQVSENTIMVHRNRIRKKLGLKNTKANLASHLRSYFT